MRLLESPRRRRRLKRLGIAAAVVAVVALVAALIPTHGPQKPSPPRNEGLAKLSSPSTKHVAAADRRAIDRTLDGFIPAAVGHADARTAWRLAGPEMRSGSTFADWRAWNVPVPSYPVAGRSFHTWSTLDSGSDYVDFNLLVHPKPGHHLGAWVFDGQMLRSHGRWVVNRLYTIAIMQPVRGSKHEIGPADFNAPPASGTPAGTPKLGRSWFLVIAGLIGLVVLLPAGFGIFALHRRWRWRARLGTQRRDLPPFPPRPPMPDTRRDKTADRH